jgi:hypothetical protein
LRISCIGLVLAGLFLTERRTQRALAVIDWLMPVTYIGLRIGETKAVLGAPQLDITSGTA